MSDHTLPPNYIPASWRGVTTVFENSGKIGVSFDTPAGPVRLAIPLADAEHIAEVIVNHVGAATRTDDLPRWLRNRR